MKSIKIEYVHDIDCSWCPINYRHLNSAIENLKELIKPDFTFLPYEVKPNMGDGGEDIAQRLMKVSGWTEAEHSDYRKKLLITAKKANLDIDFSKRTHYYNTSKAHRLLHIASLQGKQVEMNELLIKGYFSEGLNLSDVDSLIKLAKTINVDEEEVKHVLLDEEVDGELQKKYIRAKQITQSGVPAVCFNDEHIAKGTQSSDQFKEILLSLIE